MSGITVSGITGLVLAGGLGRRMSADGRGTNKALQLFAGRPLIEHALDRLRPQVAQIVINANDDVAAFARYGCPVLPDRLGGHQGPLAGLQTGLSHCATEWLVTVPCDAPLFPEDLVQRLAQAQRTSQAPIAVARTDGQLQPVFALVSVSLLASLEAFLATGQRKIDRWFEQHDFAIADFEDAEAFANLNTPGELQRLEGKA